MKQVMRPLRNVENQPQKPTPEDTAFNYDAIPEYLFKDDVLERILWEEKNTNRDYKQIRAFYDAKFAEYEQDWLRKRMRYVKKFLRPPVEEEDDL